MAVSAYSHTVPPTANIVIVDYTHEGVISVLGWLGDQDVRRCARLSHEMMRADIGHDLRTGVDLDLELILESG
jgi:hypothetical protein